MTYRDSDVDEVIPETPSMVRRRALVWLGGGTGIGVGIGLTVALGLVIRSACAHELPSVEQEAQRYVRTVWGEALRTGVACRAVDAEINWRYTCDVFVRWPDHTERRVLYCTPHGGCSEDITQRAPTAPGP